MDVNGHNMPSTVSAHKGCWPDVKSLPMGYLRQWWNHQGPVENLMSHLASKSLVTEITSIKSVSPKESKTV